MVNVAHQLQRSYTIYAAEVPRDQDLVQREWVPLAQAPSVSSYERVHHHGSTLEKAPHVKAIHDLTVAYQHRNELHKVPYMWETLKLSNLGNGHGYKFQIHAR
ncbi:1-acyl-sn-glycerol-3-phosphate acyltransferase [Seiridium cupressi]